MIVSFPFEGSIATIINKKAVLYCERPELTRSELTDPNTCKLPCTALQEAFLKACKQCYAIDQYLSLSCHTGVNVTHQEV